MKETGGVRRLALTAALAALICAATMVLTVPSPTGGYMNLGDGVILLGAVLLGPAAGAAAAGLGAALADLLAGYALYVPATLVIKAVMGAAAGLLWRQLGGRLPRGGLLLAGMAAETVMVTGYWLYDGLLLRSLAGAAAGIPSNLVQAVFGIAAGTALTLALRRTAGRRFPEV